uniref:Mitochondrial ribosomal protein S21 n=1 Tax=Oryzias sinensis TaxID=183150 RepID=A0A8C7X183_9TELE
MVSVTCIDLQMAAFPKHFLFSLCIHRLLTQDGIIDTVKRKRYYEKPCRERQRKNFENCKRIYNTEMARKIAFISRTNRDDPWLGC